MTSFYRVMAGRGSSLIDDCVAGGFIGCDFDIDRDLTGHLWEDWRQFNREFIPVFLEAVPGKTKVAAGLACGMLWTIAKGMNEGDFVLSPNGQGAYHVGSVAGPYEYAEGSSLPHRRPVAWKPELVSRAEMTQELRRAAGVPGTVSNVSKHALELAALLSGPVAPKLVALDPTVEDAATFALEKHLEDFLVENWGQTPLGQTHRIYEVDGEKVGQQYLTDTGPMDILAISLDGSELLVVELKRGRASDAVLGQIQRYMGYVKDELAEAGQTVRGVIIALDDDNRIRRALSVAPGIDFYRYEVNFKLHKA
jgi:restriction system protein